MSTTPPNTPPPYNRDAWREQRRQWREQQRAARQQARMQHEQYRAQWRMHYGQNRSSILGPLLLIALGIIFLLLSLKALAAAALLGWFRQWWPLLIVGAGLVLLAEWAADEYHHHHHPDLPHTYRRVGGGVFFLLIVLILGGLTVKSNDVNWEWLRTALSSNNSDLAQWFGQQQVADDTQTIALPSGASLDLENSHGDIVITGASSDNQVHLTLHKTVYVTGTPDQAFAQLNPMVTVGSSNVDLRIPQSDLGHADVNAQVPAGTVLLLKASHGDIHVSGTNAAVNVTNDHGDVVIDGIHGAVISHMDHGDFTAHDIHGPVSLESNSADEINFSQIDGTATVNISTAGEARFQQINGAMHYHSNRTDFGVQRINGNIDMSGEAISGQDILGPVGLTARSRNVELEHVAGAVNIRDSNANVEITALQPLAGIDVTTTGGDIDLTVPAHAGFSIDASARGGDVNDDLHTNGIRMSRSGQTGLLNGSVGSGGPELRLNTSHGNISLHQDGALGTLPAFPPLPPLLSLPSLPQKTGSANGHGKNLVDIDTGDKSIRIGADGSVSIHKNGKSIAVAPVDNNNQ